MKTRVLASLALGLALASPAGGSTLQTTPSSCITVTPSPIGKLSNQTQRSTLRAMAYAHLGPLSLFGQGTALFSVQENGNRETDGLSRNPDDCVRYGCIDNN